MLMSNPAESTPSFRASGTVTADDVEKAASAEAARIRSAGGFVLVIAGDDFDGYLAEIARGLRRVASNAAIGARRVALVAPESMMAELSEAGVTRTDGAIRAFPEADAAAARAWVHG